MANRNSPFGLQPVSNYGGGTPGRLGQYSIADQLAQNLFIGDPVVITGTGNRNGPNITIAGVADTSPIVGVFAGCRYFDADGEVQVRPYWTSGLATLGAAGAVALVYDDPNQEFEVQVDGVAGLAATDLGAHANLVAGTGSRVTGLSGWQLQQSSIETGGDGAQVQIVRLSDRPGGNEFGQFAKAIVQIRTHVYRSAVGI